MTLTPDILTNAVIGFLVIIGAVGVYLRTLRQPQPNPMIAGVAGGFIDRELMQELVKQVTRIADAVTDRNAAEIKDQLEELTEKIDRIGLRP